ncbi:ABC transporter permease [Porphyromonas pogonae]|uniref:ABC transporter permease n=1 Tax=Porphyromonas pogonae TaxID=867595 RepID=UPI002E764845|nr:FtsX-like permease family protein [Porphyromonas pogonae]
MKTYFKYLSRNKLYTFVTVFGFAVSMMFVIVLGLYVKQELSVDTFHKNKDRIFVIGSEDQSNIPNPLPEYVKNLCPEIEAYCRVCSRNIPVGIEGKKGRITKLLAADDTFFQMFSFELEEGSPRDVLTSKQSIVLTREKARELFHNENPIGKSVDVQSKRYIVTGIMKPIPDNSQFPVLDGVINYDFIRNGWGKDVMDNWGNASFYAYFLTKPGTNFQSKAPLLLKNYMNDFWIYNQGFQKEVHITRLTDIYFSERASSGGFFEIKSNSKSSVFIYLGISLLILIISVLNFINMTVAQAGSRGKEAAIKRLLGGSRRSLIMQFLKESLFLTSVSFILGLLFAFIAEPYFNDVLGTKVNLRQQFTPGVIMVCVLFVIALSFLSGILPANVISHFKPIEVIKGTFRHRIKSTYSKVLIVFQYSISMALLICSFFIYLQTQYFVKKDLGFRTDNILILPNVMDSIPQGMLRNELMQIPGVELVSFAQGDPLKGGNNESTKLNGQSISFWTFSVDSLFFKLFDIHVKNTMGETYTPTANASDNPQILPVWMDHKTFNIYRPDPKTMVYKPFDDAPPTMPTTVAVGIFDELKFKSLEIEQPPLFITSLGNESPWSFYVLVNANADKKKVTDAVTAVYTKVNGGKSFEIYHSEDIIKERYSKYARLGKLMTGFTFLTILIMIMGVFAMTLYMIRQKEKEIALRKINGATEVQMLRMLSMESVMRLAIAFAIAAPVSYFAMNKWLQGFAYHITLSWWVFVTAGVVVALLALLSVSLQTLKAARTNPIKCLKNE